MKYTDISVENELLRARIRQFAMVRGCAPYRILTEALGYYCGQTQRWMEEPHRKMRPKTMLRVHQWLDENPRWQKPKPGHQKEQHA